MQSCFLTLLRLATGVSGVVGKREELVKTVSAILTSAGGLKEEGAGLRRPDRLKGACATRMPRSVDRFVVRKNDEIIQ